MNSEILLRESVPQPEKWEVLTDLQAMRLAISEAFKGAGHVSPNPLVGAVILDSQNRFLGKGYHHRVGEPHAEIDALKSVTEAELKNARMFVTLEPCAHEGRTPSCAKTLAKTEIAEVIYGLMDPNPLVAGQGAEILRAAGKKADVYHGQHAAELTEMLEQTCEHFLFNFQQKKVWVSLKMASSLDGQMAAANGESAWITNEESRLFSHELRAFHDALSVGVGTLKTDRPQLNIRHPNWPHKKNTLVIWDTEGWCLDQDDLPIWKHHKPEDIVVFTGAQKTSNRVRVIQLKNEANGLSLAEGLSKLWDMGIRSMMVEGGGTLLSSFIAQNRFQRMYLFQGPFIFGSAGGKSWSEGISLKAMKDRKALKSLRVRSFQDDVFVTGVNK